MDVEVGEDAAGRGDVLRGRGNRVVRRGTHDQDLPDVARDHGFPRCFVARIEAALETDLHDDPGALDRVTHTIQGSEIEGDRLLAECCHR